MDSDPLGQLYLDQGGASPDWRKHDDARWPSLPFTLVRVEDLLGIHSWGNVVGDNGFVVLTDGLCDE